ncbi:helix-turn-helix domain-containing protein [Amycolatopsis thailandensis]|uniref:helix-turn-helix domain-containing protein n=1 Tax=Amycolatopsis thailandensis TaxID=589330 RepID=UPI00362CBD54
MGELGTNMRKARNAAGLSLSAMASRTRYSRNYLSQLESGARPVNRDHVVAYSRALNVAVDALYGPPLDPLRVAHEWLVADRPVMMQQEAGRRVGESLAGELEERVIEIRLLDDTLGGGDLIPLVWRELADVAEVVKTASYTEPVGRRLRVVVGELSQLAGWVASDAGHYVEAQRPTSKAYPRQTTPETRPSPGKLLSSLAYQMANVGNPADAALLARSAATGARAAPPVVRTLLLERVAWASARSRDRVAAERALDAVDDAYESRSPDIIELGDPAGAAPLLTSAIDGYDADHAREVALYQTWLAESYARAGELDAARGVIERARTAATALNSARLVRRVEEIEGLLC